MTTARATAALLAAAATLTGCTYSVEVRNFTPDPVNVRLIQLDPVQPDWVLASARVEPGERAQLKESRVAFEKVVLEANIDGVDDDPIRTRVRHGTRVYRVDPGPTATQPIVFRDDPTPWLTERERLHLAESASTPAGEREKPR